MGYKATAPEIPQLSQPSMEPELAIVVVETGKVKKEITKATALARTQQTSAKKKAAKKATKKPKAKKAKKPKKKKAKKKKKEEEGREVPGRQAAEGRPQEQGVEGSRQEDGGDDEEEGHRDLRHEDAVRRPRRDLRQGQDAAHGGDEIALGVHQEEQAQQGPHHHAGREAEGPAGRLVEHVQDGGH